MGIMENIASQARNSIIGNAERAVIIIHDHRKAPVSITQGGRGASSFLPGSTGEAAVTEKKFQVQYNPSTLKLSAQGGGLVQKTDYTAGGGVSYGAMDVQTELTVQLVFDNVNNQDAFMNEKFVLNPTAVISGIAKAAVNTGLDREYTVQPQVEAFIAALRNAKTRRVEFAWGDMCYIGILKHVGARYTMFSVSGRPIRAVVDLGIYCSDPSIAAGDMGQWEKYYHAAFAPLPDSGR